MTDKQYSKEEQFLRELTQVCKKYNAGLLVDRFLGLMAIYELNIKNIQIMADGKYVARGGNDETIMGRVE